MTPVAAMRGHQIGMWDGERFTPAPPLVACLMHAARAERTRADLAGVIIVGYWNMPIGASA